MTPAAMKRKTTHLSEEEKVALQLYYTPGRQTYLVGFGILLTLCGGVRLIRVALGVETAPGANSTTQVGTFAFFLLLGLTLVTLFTSLTKLKLSPGAVHDACAVTLTTVSVTLQIQIASFVSQDEPPPPEVCLFIGAVVTAVPCVPNGLMLGNKISLFISVLSYIQAGFFMVFSFDIVLIFTAFQFVMYFVCTSVFSDQQDSFLHQRTIEGQHCLNLT